MVTETPKFSNKDIQEFVVFYYGNREHKDYKWLRFGQAFFYFFKDRGMDKVKDAELFYAQTPTEALAAIYRRYLIKP